MLRDRKFIASWKDWWFARVHKNTLIYNTCWEDPVSDKAGLGIQRDSDILMITSAGCNALSYLLDDPASVDCVDLNPRQNALLELKMACFNSSDHKTLFQIFGNGIYPGFRKFYREKLRPGLSTEAQYFWDKHQYYFSGRGIRKSFYQHGTAGILAFLADKYIAVQPGLRKDLMRIFNAKSMDEQRENYKKAESRILKQWIRPILQNHLTMSLAGIPVDQQQLAAQTDPEGMFGYIKRSLRSVFMHLPASQNYFWRLYAEGKYSGNCCPEYLEENNFEILRERMQRITIATNSIEDHLNATDKRYSHFILLDHQDWLSKRNMKSLIDEWNAIFRAAKPGAKVLMRSAAASPDFLPEEILAKLERNRSEENKMKALDRVGTYTSTWLMTIK